MRTYYTTDDSRNQYDVVAPDELILSGNKNIISITKVASGRWIDGMTVTVDGNHSFFVKLYEGKCSFNVNDFISYVYDEAMLNDRYKQVMVEISYSGAVRCQIPFTLINATIGIGERIANIGMYDREKAEHYHRTIRRFVNFPFTLSFLGTKGSTYMTRKLHDAEYSVIETLESDKIIDFVNPDFDVLKVVNDEQKSEFTDHYTYHFFRLGKNDSLYRIENDSRKCGLFLRWIDDRGFWMQYLFTAGNATTSTNRAYVVDNGTTNIFDMFVDSFRTVRKNATFDITIGATRLNPIEYKDVSSIITSYRVELYCGKDEQGNDVFMPVKVKTDSLKHNTRKVLNDIEVDVTVYQKKYME